MTTNNKTMEERFDEMIIKTLKNTNSEVSDIPYGLISNYKHFITQELALAKEEWVREAREDIKNNFIIGEINIESNKNINISELLDVKQKAESFKNERNSLIEEILFLPTLSINNEEK